MENKKETKVIKFLLFLSLITTIAYFMYTVIASNNEVEQLSIIVGAAALTTFAIFFVFMGLTINDKGRNYAILGACLLTCYSGYELLIDSNILSLPKQGYVEDFTYKSSVKAIKWAEKNKVEINQIFENSDTVEEFYVINQDITPGTLAKKVDKLTIVVSEGPNLEKDVVIPNMIGWPAEDVLDFINKNHLSNVEVEFIVSDKTKNTVIEQLGTGEMKRNSYIKLTFSIGSENDIKEVKIIDLVNKSKFEATFWLKQHGIKYNENSNYSDTIKRNNVMKQSIKEGTKVNPNNDNITITISKGSKIVVPDLTNMNLTEITEWISQNRLKIDLSDKYDEKIKANMPIEVSHKKGEEIEEGTIIKIVISKGPLQMEAFSSLAEFKMWADTYEVKYNETYEFSDNISQGEVISWSHKKGDTIKNNDAVTVTISQGKKTTVPNFSGKNKSEITKQCNQLNLSCSFLYKYSNTVAEGKAISQSKAAGTEVSENTFISITLSNGKKYTSSNNSSSNSNNNGSSSNIPTTPSCDTSQGTTFYIAPGNTGNQVLSATKSQNPGFKVVANYVDSCDNGATTSGMVCNSNSYDSKWISYCDTIYLTIVK